MVTYNVSLLIIYQPLDEGGLGAVSHLIQSSHTGKFSQLLVADVKKNAKINVKI